MKLKRIISLVLALTMVLSLSFTTAYADGWGNGKIPPGQAKKMFNDIDLYEWAMQYIEKMYSKGLLKGKGNGKYEPQSSVTQIEAIVMALRVMGWEDKALEIKELPKKYKGAKVADWAKGYITLAYEKGILDDVDMMYFKPQDPVKRHEVAKYVVRAIGYEEEAQDNMNAKLPFVDASAVPQGSVGYVYVINDLEIMEGDNAKTFNPMGTLTRAEMAVLFSRLDDKIDTDKDERVSGIVKDIDDDEITVKVDGQTKTYDVDDDVRVYENRKRMDYDDIRVGDMVNMEIVDGDVIYIEIVDELDDDKIISRYSGVVKELDKEKPYTMAVQVETMILLLKVVDNVEVEFKDDDADFEDIEVGDNVEVVVDTKNRVTEIYVDANIGNDDDDDDYYEDKGTITDIDLNGSYHITIDDEEYDLDEDAEVEINGKGGELEDLVIGMYAEVEIEDDVVVWIEAETVEEELSGKIGDMDDDEIKIKKDNGKYVVYEVSENVNIKIDGIRNPELDDLEIGDYAKFEIENGLIVSIEVVNEITEVTGILVSFNSDKVKIRTNNKEYEYEFADIVKIEVKNHKGNLNSLEPGMKIELEIKNNEVISIYAEDRRFEVEGDITAITVSDKGTTLKIKLEDSDKQVSYLVSEDAEIEIEDVRRPSIDDLEVGQEGEFEVVNSTIVKVSIDD